MNDTRSAMARVAILLAVTAVMGCQPEPEQKTWKTTDVWYHESDVAKLNRSGRPQLVEFFHPD